jgi:hypothetical protein
LSLRLELRAEVLRVKDRPLGLSRNWHQKRGQKDADSDLPSPRITGMGAYRAKRISSICCARARHAPRFAI